MIKHLLPIFLISIAQLAFAQTPSSELVFEVREAEILAKGIQKPVRYVFKYAVAGTRPVRITAIKTDCACTVVSYDDKLQLPGSNGEILVEYAPYRPGKFSKGFEVLTDKGEAVTLTISGFIQPGDADAQLVYPYKMGSLRLKGKNINLGKINSKSLLRKTVTVFNDNDFDIWLKDSVDSPSHIELAFDENKRIKAFHSQDFLLYYNPFLKKEFGYSEDQITFFAESPKEETYQLTVTATLQEYFSDTLGGMFPSISLVDSLQDIGSISSKDSRLVNFRIKNIGKTPLDIHKVIPDEGCQLISLSKKRLLAEEEGVVTVRFKDNGKQGSDLRAITIYTNDPNRISAKVFIKAYVKD